MILQNCNSNEVNKLILGTMTSLPKTINDFGTQRNHKSPKSTIIFACYRLMYTLSSLNDSLEIINTERNCILSKIVTSIPLI